MDRLFFSKENFKIIYGILQKKIQDTSQYNIDSNPQSTKELVNIMKAIYQQRGTFNLPANMSDIDLSRYLSQKEIFDIHSVLRFIAIYIYYDISF